MKRYNLKPTLLVDGGINKQCIHISQDPDGDWVLWEDADRMRADADGLRKALFRANARAEKLLRYAQHRATCRRIRTGGSKYLQDCTCGLAELEGTE